MNRHSETQPHDHCDCSSHAGIWHTDEENSTRQNIPQSLCCQPNFLNNAFMKLSACPSGLILSNVLLVTGNSLRDHCRPTQFTILFGSVRWNGHGLPCTIALMLITCIGAAPTGLSGYVTGTPTMISGQKSRWAACSAAALRKGKLLFTCSWSFGRTK